MRQGTNGRRNNQRRHQQQHNVQNQRRQGSFNRNTVLDSIGPDVKIRGTVTQIFEKYSSLAREAQGAGDPVLAESYYQHADHYFRLMNSLGVASESVMRRQEELQDLFPDEDEMREQLAMQQEQPSVSGNAFIPKDEDVLMAHQEKQVFTGNEEQPEIHPGNFVGTKSENLPGIDAPNARNNRRDQSFQQRRQRQPRSDMGRDVVGNAQQPLPETADSDPSQISVSPGEDKARRAPDRRRRPQTQPNLFEQERGNQEGLDSFDTIPDFLKGEDDVSRKPSKDFFLLDDEDEKL